MGITEDGREQAVLNSGNSLTGLKISAINIGSGSTDFAAGDTSLETEVDFEGALDAAVSGNDATVMTINAVFEDNDATIREAGMVCQDDPTNDTQASKTADDVQYSRQTVPEVNLLSTDKLDVTFELQMLNSSS